MPSGCRCLSDRFVRSDQASLNKCFWRSRFLRFCRRSNEGDDGNLLWKQQLRFVMNAGGPIFGDRTLSLCRSRLRDTLENRVPIALRGAKTRRVLFFAFETGSFTPRREDAKRAPAFATYDERPTTYT